MAILPKSIYKFKAVSIKIPAGFCAEIDKPVLKFIWKFKGLRIAKRILKKKNKVERLILSDFETHYKATKQCGYGIKIDILISGTELRVRK